MRFFAFLFLLASSCFSAVPKTTESIVESLLKSSCQKEWSESVRVELENVFTKDAVGKNPSLVSVFPRPAIGVVNFEVAWESKGQMQRTQGNAVVRVYAKVAVAKDTIRSSDELASAGIVFEERDLSRLTQSGFFTTPEELQGKVARGMIRPGTILGLMNAETPAPIVAGQIVDLIHGTPTVTITAKVKALEKGKVGSWIRVENTKSKKILRARVVAAGEVRLK